MEKEQKPMRNPNEFKNNNSFISTGRVGRINYMSPEVFAWKQYDCRLADVYCLGIMLFMIIVRVH